MKNKYRKNKIFLFYMSKKLKMWPMRRPQDWQIVPLIGIIDDIKPNPILSIIPISGTTKTIEPALPKTRRPPAAEPLLMPAAEPSVDKQMVLQLAMEAEEAKKKATELSQASFNLKQAEIIRQAAAKKEAERKEAEALTLQAEAADALKVTELRNAERARIQLEKEAEQLLFEEAKKKQIELDLEMQKAAEEAKEAKEKAREAADINIHQPRQTVELSGTDVPGLIKGINAVDTESNSRTALTRGLEKEGANPAQREELAWAPGPGKKVEFKPLMADSQLNAIERIVKARGDKVSDSIANYPRGPNKPHREGKEFRPANKKGGTRKIKKKSKKTKKNNNKKIYKTKKDKNIKTRKNVTKKYTIKKKDARRFNYRK
jgi:hypothetical protein